MHPTTELTSILHPDHEASLPYCREVKPSQPSSLSLIPGNDSTATRITDTQIETEITIQATHTVACHNTTLRDEDWEDKREVITALYQTMSLDRLIIEMKERHMFDAKRKSYVRRFRKWGIQKNYKASQKKAVAEHIQRHGTDPIPEDLASIPLNRVKRWIRSKRKEAGRNALDENVEHNTSRSPVSFQPPTAPIIGSSQSDQNVNALMQAALLMIPSKHKSEVLLSRLQEYTEARLQTLEDQTGTSSDTLCFETHHISAKYLFSIYTTIVVVQKLPWPDKRADFLKALNDFCSLVKSALQESHWRMMPVLLLALQLIWQRDQNTGKAIVRFVREMTQTVFPHNPKHPLMQMLDIFWDINQNVTATLTSGETQCDAGHMDILEDASDFASVNSDLCRSYRTLGLSSSTSQATENNYRLCLRKYGPEDSAAQMTHVVLHHLLANDDPVAGEMYQIKLCLEMFGRSIDLSTENFQELFDLLDHDRSWKKF